MRKIIYLLLVLIVFSSCDKEKNYLRDGNKAFEKKDYTDAEESFRRSIAIDSSYIKAHYNLANTTYKKGKESEYNKSIIYYDKALKTDTLMDSTFRSDILFNKANANFKLALLDSVYKSEKYIEGLKKAAQGYVDVLKINPKDSSAKYNLALALHLLKQNENNKQNKQQQQQNQNQNQQQKNKQDKKEQQGQQGGDDNQDKKDQNKKNGESDQMKKQKQQEAERMLEALKNNEKNTLERLKKDKDKKAKTIRNEKDW